MIKRILPLLAVLFVLMAGSALAQTATATATATPTATATATPAAPSTGWFTQYFHPPISAGAAGQVPAAVATDAINGQVPAMTWVPQAVFNIGWDGDLGTLTNAATKTMVAPCTGHFTSLTCGATLTGTCTTPPAINVDNTTTPATGTAITLNTTVGTPQVQAQTLVFTSGNTIGLAQTASPGTCTVPRFSCLGTMTCP